MEPKYTSKEMPVISQETLDALLSRYSGERNGEWGQYITEVQQRIVREDPVLVKFLEMQVGTNFPKELHTSVFQVLVGLYAVLENQTEANSLNKIHDIK